MPSFQISDLTSTNSPTIDSIIPCVQEGVTKQISILQIKQYLDDGTLRELSQGVGMLCNPNPITSTGNVSFYAPGLMALYAGASDPTGWLICNGRSLVVSSYQDLFNRIGYRYGGSGVNFNIPNLVGRSVFGLDNMGASSAGRISDPNSSTLGAVSGSISSTLTQEQAPLISHTHSASGSFTVPTNRGWYGNNSALRTGFPRTDFNTTSGGCSTTLSLSIGQSQTSSNAPATQSHPNLPPFLLLNWIIKI